MHSGDVDGHRHSRYLPAGDDDLLAQNCIDLDAGSVERLHRVSEHLLEEKSVDVAWRRLAEMPLQRADHVSKSDTENLQAGCLPAFFVVEAGVSSHFEDAPK